MDSKKLLLHMSHRLYEDIKFVTAQNPTQIVDDDGVRAFNNLLAKTRKYFARCEFTGDFTDWSPRTIKYKDAMVSAGQLFAMIEALVVVQPAPSYYDSPVGSGSYREPTTDSTLAGPSESGSARVSTDDDLYGSNPPPVRNADGTIPFRLD